MKHRHSGPKVRYRTSRGRIRERDRPMHRLTANKPKEGRRGSRKMAWDLGRAEEEGNIVDWMSPDEYLKKTGLDPDDLPGYMDTFYDNDKGESRPIEELSEYIKSDDVNVTIPWVGDSSVFGAAHEGRHRALAAKLAGDEEVPVAVPLPKNVREEIAEIFIERAFPDSDPTYQREWRERFRDGLPNRRMDRQNAAIYSGVLKDLDLIND